MCLRRVILWPSAMIEELDEYGTVAAGGALDGRRGVCRMEAACSAAKRVRVDVEFAD